MQVGGPPVEVSLAAGLQFEEVGGYTDEFDLEAVQDQLLPLLVEPDSALQSQSNGLLCRQSQLPLQFDGAGIQIEVLRLKPLYLDYGGRGAVGGQQFQPRVRQPQHLHIERQRQRQGHLCPGGRAGFGLGLAALQVEFIELGVTHRAAVDFRLFLSGGYSAGKTVEAERVDLHPAGQKRQQL